MRTKMTMHLVDAKNLQCPGPIMALFNMANKAKKGDIIKVEAKDPGFVPDVKAWCKRTGNELMNLEKKGDVFIAKIRKE